jgi:AcrR family transcriptional regulator
MPKTYNQNEREFIKKRLREEAMLCLEQYGMRKTSVDELVRRVGIPKGTFYLFYGSKELLFYDVFIGFHDEIQEKVRAGIENMKQDITPARLTELFFSLYKQAESSFLLKFLTGGDLEMMLRKLPPEVAVMHTEKDDLNIEKIISYIPGMEPDRVRVFSAALRGVFLSMLHKREIGEEVFDESLKVLIRGVVMQMFGGCAA